MKPKKGKSLTPVTPATPDEAEDADDADPGEVAKIKAEQIKTKSGKYGSEKVKPFKGPESGDEENEQTTWIEVELVDMEDNPVPGEAYEITLPDGETVASGTLDENGVARVDGIEPGTCEITFPDLDKDAWEPA
jgi:type VI secretion system secreted protein VgrG